MNILIIGGTRFMGPVVARELISGGHAVTVFHRGETDNDTPDTVRHIHGDRDRLSDYRSQFQQLQPDVVLDMMVLTPQQAADLVSTVTGITGRLVVASSCDVYKNYGSLWQREPGESTSGRLTEDSALRENLYPYREDVKGPADPLYNYDKILVEQEMMNGPISATALRLPMVYGPNDRQHRLYGYMKRMIDHRPAILLDQERIDWRGIRGYRDNCAHAISQAVTNPASAGRIYNVGEPRALTETGWITAIADIIGWNGQIVPVPDGQLPDYLQTPLDWSHQLDVDSSRIRRELDFNETVDFKEGLRRTIEWELANPPAAPADKFDYNAEDKLLRKAGDTTL